MDQDLLKIAEMLESEAKRLRKKAFDNRPMPDSWRVGQKVRLLKNKEWCADAGDVLMIVEVRRREERRGEERRMKSIGEHSNRVEGES